MKPNKPLSLFFAFLEAFYGTKFGKFSCQSGMIVIFVLYSRPLECRSIPLSSQFFYPILSVSCSAEITHTSPK